MGLIAELQRRNVIRMAGLYVVGAWLVVQVADTLLPVFDTPAWVMRALVILLAIGFVPALVFAWVFELTPEGLKRDDEVLPEHSIAPQTAQRMNRSIIALLLLALGYFAVDKFVLTQESGAAPELTVNVDDQNAGIAAKPDQQSIAVLAFVDMSPQKDQEYFADGISEEILNALAKVDGLKVAGRTSAFYFKGRNENLSDIGQALGVAHILEGSIRKQGNRVRITAQLIRASNGYHQWSETYDGDLDDVFDLQERIARSITDQLKIVLQGKQAERLVHAGTRNPEAYALYLKATDTFNRRDGAHFDEALAQLQQAIALDPDFARAWSRMATLQAVRSNYQSGDFNAFLEATEQSARRALALDPSLAEPYAALGLTYGNQRQYRQQREAFARAFVLDPNDVTVNFWHAAALLETGYREQAKQALDRTLAIDPLLPNALLWRARLHIADGELNIATEQLRRAEEAGHVFVGLGTSSLYMAQGERSRAIAALTAAMPYFAQDFPSQASEVFARACFRDPEAKAEAIGLIDAYLANHPDNLPGVVSYVLRRSGEYERAFKLMSERISNNEALSVSGLFTGLDPDAMRSPSFGVFIDRSGLGAYWDEFGPPDNCRREDAGAYHCDPPTAADPTKVSP